MAAGYEVTKPVLDQKMAAAIVQVRDGLDEVQKIAKFLSRTDDASLVGLGYNDDEVYLIRLAFEKMEALRKTAVGETGGTNHFEVSEKLTGLE